MSFIHCPRHDKGVFLDSNFVEKHCLENGIYIFNQDEWSDNYLNCKWLDENWKSIKGRVVKKGSVKLLFNDGTEKILEIPEKDVSEHNVPDLNFVNVIEIPIPGKCTLLYKHCSSTKLEEIVYSVIAANFLGWVDSLGKILRKFYKKVDDCKNFDIGIPEQDLTQFFGIDFVFDETQENLNWSKIKWLKHYKEKWIFDLVRNIKLDEISEWFEHYKYRHENLWNAVRKYKKYSFVVPLIKAGFKFGNIEDRCLEECEEYYSEYPQLIERDLVKKCNEKAIPNLARCAVKMQVKLDLSNNFKRILLYIIVNGVDFFTEFIKLDIVGHSSGKIWNTRSENFVNEFLVRLK